MLLKDGERLFIRIYAKKFALRQAQGERRAKRQHHRPFVVSLPNHVA